MKEIILTTGLEGFLSVIQALLAFTNCIQDVQILLSFWRKLLFLFQTSNIALIDFFFTENTKNQVTSFHDFSVLKLIADELNIVMNRRLKNTSIYNFTTCSHRDE